MIGAFVLFQFSIDYPSHNWLRKGAFILYRCFDRLLDKVLKHFDSVILSFFMYLFVGESLTLHMFHDKISGVSFARENMK